MLFAYKFCCGSTCFRKLLIKVIFDRPRIMHPNRLTLPYNINHREKCMFRIPANYLVIKLFKLI